MEHLEGRQSVFAALQAGQRRFQTILIRHGLHLERVQDILELAATRNIPWRYAAREELDALAHGATHGGVLAVCAPKARMSPDELIELLARLRQPALLLLLEGVDDPRNLGFTLRTADALGAHAVLIKKHVWDFDPVEVARPSAGADERLPLVQLDEVAPVRELQKRGLQLIGCLAGAKRSLEQTDLRTPTILAVGGEKRGLSGALRAICDAFTTIPTRPGGPSLALSHAAAVVLAEAARQRRLDMTPAGAGGE
jgi:23S rRNA (guanosine2251-2'-O)-methyltransferase